ncbi:MAG: hypothetical protein QOD42_2930 [Sphingomonadales bacterium]|jgi:tetratricopeptide (TPR) repeat protein|nr:hypothetical protein [Sphingomonadales bacterium]
MTIARPLRLAAIALALALPGAAAAAPLPTPEQMATPEERRSMMRLLEIVTGAREAGRDPLPALDGLLAEARAPSLYRGVLQGMRAEILVERRRWGEARDAIEESIRLLPGYSAPLYAATLIENYSDRPAAATDYFLRAAAIDPQIARDFGDWHIRSLVERLRGERDRRRLSLLAGRLFEVGWRGDDIGLRSSLASDLIRDLVARGDLARARTLVPQLILPADARALLVEHRYRALWPDIEAWTGPRQRRQWRLYLAETRGRWEASHDSSRALDHFHALVAAGHDDALIAELLPRLTGPLDPAGDYDLIWTVPALAGALGHRGRWADVERLYADTLGTWPLGSDANALNLAANRPKSLLWNGEAARALVAIDAAIADAPRWGGQASGAALATMYSIRACILHVLGRRDEALAVLASSTAGAPIEALAETFLCLERPDSLRTILLEALAVEGTRAEVLAYLQPSGVAPTRSPLGLAHHARHQAMRRDPALLAAVRAYGRILPYALNAGAPPDPAAR